MRPFYTRFPALAAQETRTVTFVNHAEIPAGQYGFVEWFCDDPACDCRRVMINVVAATNPARPLAIINYGWESLAFYEQWMRDKTNAREAVGATLDSLNPQSRYAPTFLRLFKQQLQDPTYVARLQRHYAMFKNLPATPPAITPDQSASSPLRKLRRRRR